MKVLFLTNIPAPYRVSFFNELGKMCDLTVLYERKNANDRDSKWFEHKAKTYKEIYLKGVKISSDTSFCPQILKFFLRDKFDIIVVGGYSTPTSIFSIILLKLFNKKFVLNADGGIIKDDKVLKYKFKEFLISSASYWLSTGKCTNEYLKHYGAKESNIYVYPFSSVTANSILKNLISNTEKQKIKDKLGIKESKVIISVGQFIPRKGFDILLEAAKEIDGSFGIYIIGGTPTKEYLEIKDKHKLVNVYFIPFKNNKSLTEYYEAADLFVLPTREDIWGLVINEAMACGLPIITTNKCVAGIELIENDVNGYIVDVEDYKQLAKTINILCKDNRLLLQVGEANLNKIKYYTIENMAKIHYEIFSEITKGE